MFQSRSKRVNILYQSTTWLWFVFICVIFFCNGVNGRGFLTLRPSSSMDDLTLKITSRKMIVVDVNGSGKFNSIQDAIDSIPDGNQDWVVIHVKKGIYRYAVRLLLHKKKSCNDIIQFIFFIKFTNKLKSKNRKKVMW